MRKWFALSALLLTAPSIAQGDLSAGFDIRLPVSMMPSDEPGGRFQRVALDVGEEVRVTEFVEGWFKVLFAEGQGYVAGDVLMERCEPAEAELLKTLAAPELERMRARNAAAWEARSREIAEQMAYAWQSRQQALEGRFGSDVAAKILVRSVWIGMSAEMALESQGTPIEINRTVTASVVREQWVYGTGVYLYFDNGVLTAVQDKPPVPAR